MKVREDANGSDGYENEVHDILVILVLESMPEPRVSEGANYSKNVEFDASLVFLGTLITCSEEVRRIIVVAPCWML